MRRYGGDERRGIEVLRTYDKGGALHSQQLEFLNYLLTGEWQPVRVPQAPLNEYLGNAWVFAGTETIEIRTPVSTRFARCIDFKDYPENTEPGILNKMFTGRYDTRIWDQNLRRVMPNIDPAKPVAALRNAIYGDLERVRLLRNRIAHHEPMFARALADDYQTILVLVTYRCAVTAAWLDSHQTATAIITAKP
ncbi:hypothetical protein [Xanthomonas citri]|uniref:VirB4 family type IV secretion/conjugal transfer ATPase n=1 Tax=Xanthomonas citri TaxID=346 RepID=UPI000308FCAA|nr:hypothetical protein [Xanthomonas citri]